MPARYTIIDQDSSTVAEGIDGTPKYVIEKLGDDGSWRIYRDGQRFNSSDAARRLLNRLMDHHGEDRIRLSPDWA